MSNTPDWMPWVLVGASLMSSLLILILGIFLKGIKTDVSKNTDLTQNIMVTMFGTKAELTGMIHNLEKKVLESYTPIGQHNELRGSVHKLRDDIAPLKAREDFRRLTEANRP